MFLTNAALLQKSLDKSSAKFKSKTKKIPIQHALQGPIREGDVHALGSGPFDLLTVDVPVSCSILVKILSS